MRRALILLILLIPPSAAGLACGRDAAREATRDTLPTASRAGADTTASTTAARPKCPATGQWSQCAIIERLDRAGLAPRLDSSAVATHPPLAPTGFVVRMSRGDAEVYLYDDEGGRKRDEAKLDRSRFLEYGEPVSMQTVPTLISSGNVLIILNSRNDHQRERVGDAITAGPPGKQTSKPSSTQP